MEDQLPYQNLSRRQERRLIESVSNAVKSDFLNPERFGCPETGALIEISKGQLSSPEAEDIIDHIATCSPCLIEYGEHRRRHRLRMVMKMALASAAALISVVAFWLIGPGREGRRQPHMAKETASAPLRAMLDFRNRTTDRSELTQPPRRDVIPHLKRAVLNLTIKLPIGIEDGIYHIELRTPSSRAVLHTSGVAAWRDGAETLTSKIDCRGTARGEYILAIRRDASAWRLYSVILD
jgi:hypothetical protein